MPEFRGVRIHSCSMNEQSMRIVVQFASARLKKAARITGGAGLMGGADIQGLTEMTEAGFAGFAGTVFGGGTQMRMRSNPRAAIMGITEMLPIIRGVAPECVIIGITPRLSDLIMIDGIGLMVSDGRHPGKPPAPYITIVHPDLDVCLLLQYSADIPLKSWQYEWKTSLDFMGMLRNDAQTPFATAHVFYNGGSETEKELLALTRMPFEPDNPWRVFLVSDSGRITQQYAEDRAFCDEFADRIVVCTKAEFPERFQDWAAA